MMMVKVIVMTIALFVPMSRDDSNLICYIKFFKNLCGILIIIVMIIVMVMMVMVIMITIPASLGDHYHCP